jgi:hypothetical protein
MLRATDLRRGPVGDRLQAMSINRVRPSRREFCIGGGASIVLPCGAVALAGEWGPDRDRADPGFDDYGSTLVNGLTPSPIVWNGRKWRANMASTRVRGLDYCLRVTPNKARFEIRDNPLEGRHGASPHGLRSEISGSVYGDRTRLPNGVPLWGAMQFIHHHWDDPEGMKTLYGGVHGQIHIGSRFGGSPALAFRRNKRGEFDVTTRGEFDKAGSGTVRHRSPLPFDQVHNLVYRIVLHEADGALTVWLNARKIVDIANVSIGSHHAEAYWNLGCYYSGGVTCPVVAEYANHVYPGRTSLAGRIASPPAWPRR